MQIGLTYGNIFLGKVAYYFVWYVHKEGGNRAQKMLQCPGVKIASQKIAFKRLTLKHEKMARKSMFLCKAYGLETLVVRRPMGSNPRYLGIKRLGRISR